MFISNHITICLHPLSLTLSFHRVHRSCCKSLNSHFLCLRFDDVSFKSRRICGGRIKKSARPGGRGKRPVVNNGGNVFSEKWTWFYDLLRFALSPLSFPFPLILLLLSRLQSNYHQVTFIEEGGQRCEEILEQILNTRIGVDPRYKGSPYIFNCS